MNGNWNGNCFFSRHFAVHLKNILQHVLNPFLAIIYLFKFNNRNTRKMCEVCSKLTTKTTE